MSATEKEPAPLLRRPKSCSELKHQNGMVKSENFIQDNTNINSLSSENQQKLSPPKVINVSRRSITRSNTEKNQILEEDSQSISSIQEFCDQKNLEETIVHHQSENDSVEECSVIKIWEKLEKDLVHARKSYIEANAKEAKVIEDFHQFLKTYGDEARQVINIKWYDRIKRREEARSTMKASLRVSLMRSDSDVI